MPWRPVTAGFLVAGLAACTGQPGASVSNADPTPSALPESSSAPSSALPPGVARALAFGEPVYGIEKAGETFWVEGRNVLYQVDGSTGEVIQQLPGSGPSVIADSLWYQLEQELIEADAASGAELHRYRPPKLGARTVKDGVLWVASEDDGMLTRISLESNAVLGEVALPFGEPKAVVAFGGAVWVVVDGMDVVLRFDATTGELTDTIEPGSRPHSVLVAFDSLWVINHGSASLVRLEPEHGAVLTTIQGPGLNVAITAAGESVWAATWNGLAEIDPGANTIVDQIELGSGEEYAMVESAGSLWLTTGEGGVVYEIPVP